jgi:hypothetical protein
MLPLDRRRPRRLVHLGDAHEDRLLLLLLLLLL